MLGVAGGIAAYKSVEVCRRSSTPACYVSPVLTDGRATLRRARPPSPRSARSRRARRLFGSPEPIPHTHLGQTRRPDRRRAGHREAARQVRGRHLRRPADRHAARHPRAGARVPGDAHRDVGAPGGAGEPRDAGAPRCARARARSGRSRGRRRRAWAASPKSRAIVDAVLAVLAACRGDTPSGTPGSLAGRRVLVTAGGTREPIDPVRYVGNRSSGKMGHAIAAVAGAAAPTCARHHRRPSGSGRCHRGRARRDRGRDARRGAAACGRRRRDRDGRRGGRLPSRRRRVPTRPRSRPRRRCPEPSCSSPPPTSSPSSARASPRARWSSALRPRPTTS